MSTDKKKREFVSVDELAEILGLNRKTVYAAIRRGEIPGVRRIGGRVIAHLPTVTQWVAAGEQTDSTT